MTCAITTFNFTRGATFELVCRLPDHIADGHFAGWVPTSQLRAKNDDLIADLQIEWADALVARLLRVSASDTSAWPLTMATFDICLTSPEGKRVYTSPQSLQIVKGNTRHA